MMLVNDVQKWRYLNQIDEKRNKLSWLTRNVDRLSNNGKKQIKEANRKLFFWKQSGEFQPLELLVFILLQFHS